MSDEGYTLAEMLTALTILGLALGGLGLVTSLISRQQWMASRLHTQLVQDRAADQALGQWLAGLDAAKLQGDGRTLSAPCGVRICRAHVGQEGRRSVLALHGATGSVRRIGLRHRDLRFSFVHAGGAAPAWPLANAKGEERPLRAVRLAAADTAPPVALARAWPFEPRDCHFDVVVGACRTPTP